MRASVAGMILSALLLVPSAAVAQEPVADRPLSVYASIGMGRLNSEGSHGNGPDVGGGFAYQFNPRFAASIDLDYWRHKRRLASGGTHEGSGLFATGNLVVYFFPERRHQLYLLGGGGWGRYQPRDQPDLAAPGPP